MNAIVKAGLKRKRMAETIVEELIADPSLVENVAELLTADEAFRGHKGRPGQRGGSAPKAGGGGGLSSATLNTMHRMHNVGGDVSVRSMGALIKKGLARKHGDGEVTLTSKGKRILQKAYKDRSF